METEKHPCVASRRLNSPEQIAFIKIDSMSFQECLILLGKGRDTMMFWLSADVVSNRRYLRLAHREGAISVLPAKVAQGRKVLMHPAGRRSLDQLHRLGQREAWGKNKEKMDVICDPADLDGFHTILPSDPSEVGPKPFAHGFVETRFSSFGAEHHMILERGVGVGHGERQVQLKRRYATTQWRRYKFRR